MARLAKIPEPKRGALYHEVVGHYAMARHDYKSALAAYRAAREAGNPFDVLILDLTVRGGEGGLETMTRLREIDQNRSARGVVRRRLDELALPAQPVPADLLRRRAGAGRPRAPRRPRSRASGRARP